MVAAILWLFSWLRAILMWTLAWDCKHIHAELQSKCWPLSQLLVHGWAWTDGQFPTCWHWASWIGGSISDMHVMIMTHWLGLLHGLDKSFVLWRSSCTLLQFTDYDSLTSALLGWSISLIYTADLLGEKNNVLWLISRLIMAAEQTRKFPVFRFPGS